MSVGDDLIYRATGPWGAVFSACERWRYLLWRDIEAPLLPDTRGTLMFLMLNPSTADETKNDPTVAGCLTRARAWGFKRLEVCNIFALRSTDPAGLYRGVLDPVGAHNDRFILESARAAELVVCAWGVHGAHMERGRAVADRLTEEGVKTHALRLTASGHPGHPLYLPHRLTPRRWRPWAGAGAL